MEYIPARVFFEKGSLNYQLGNQLYEYFSKTNIPVVFLDNHNKVTGIPGKTPQESYLEGKKTMVVGVRKTLEFETCKPSAHYQLPLVTSCAGKCEYCYLNTQLGKKPYIRIYANIDEILNKAQQYIDKGKPEIILFEGAATSDPLIVEPYTGSLAKTIDFFSQQEFAQFRFVTKFTNVDSLLNIKHNNKTTIRFSINSDNIIKSYEHSTPSLSERINASKKIISAGYPVGFIIAPVFLDKGWQDNYYSMLKNLRETLIDYLESNISFEIISHRFTERAKNNILSIFPNTQLPMDKENRRFKYGQFGYGKYVYTNELLDEMKEFFSQKINNLFPNSTINYII